MDICKLTKTPGKFVNSHLIPKALTKPRDPNYPFLQLSVDDRPKRRWSSWSDRKLVTRKGEDVLEALDTWAIKELRRHKMVWSSWGQSKSLGDAHSPLGDSHIGIRGFDDLDGKKLRLFFLSLLWRAAATERAEFKEIQISAEHLERLRRFIVRDSEESIGFYPVSLTQLSTIGEVHNCAPKYEMKIVPETDEYPKMDVPFFRFYFDGLIAHINLPYEDPSLARELGPFILGNEKRLTISTIKYENAKQMEFVKLLKGAIIQIQP